MKNILNAYINDDGTNTLMSDYIRAHDKLAGLRLGLGKVVKVGKVVLNIFAEPQFRAMAEGYGQPKLQTFIGFDNSILKYG